MATVMQLRRRSTVTQSLEQKAESGRSDPNGEHEDIEKDAHSDTRIGYLHPTTPVPLVPNQLSTQVCDTPDPHGSTSAPRLENHKLTLPGMAKNACRVPPFATLKESSLEATPPRAPSKCSLRCDVYLRTDVNHRGTLTRHIKLDASAVLRSGTCRHALCGTHAPSLTKEAIAAGLLTKDGKPSPTAGQFASRSLSFRVKTLVDNLALMTAKSEALPSDLIIAFNTSNMLYAHLTPCLRIGCEVQTSRHVFVSDVKCTPHAMSSYRM
eukprot:g41705.t1